MGVSMLPFEFFSMVCFRFSSGCRRNGYLFLNTYFSPIMNEYWYWSAVLSSLR